MQRWSRWRRSTGIRWSCWKAASINDDCGLHELRRTSMSRILTVGAAQLGPIQRSESRAQAVERLMVLMRAAKAHGCDLVIFPECALTAFFPHWYFDRQEDIDAFFEREMPNAATQPLFDLARQLQIGFYLGFAELAIEDG